MDMRKVQLTKLKEIKCTWEGGRERNIFFTLQGATL